MKFLKNAGSTVLVIAVLVGWRLYNKSADADEIKAALLDVCEQESECLAAVESHFDTCFNESYDMGGRHRAASLDGSHLSECINRHAGSNYFAYSSTD